MTGIGWDYRKNESIRESEAISGQPKKFHIVFIIAKWNHVKWLFSYTWIESNLDSENGKALLVHAILFVKFLN